MALGRRHRRCWVTHDAAHATDAFEHLVRRDVGPGEREEGAEHRGKARTWGIYP